MSISVLIIGFGSIGRRHAKILSTFREVKNIFVLTSQNDIHYDKISKIEQILILDVDYIIIASNTALHFKYLKFLEDNLKGKKVLVEKPLFEKFYKMKVKNNLVFVGYNLRFHPIINFIKDKIEDNRIWFVEARCGSYLPDWGGRDYRHTSSAK